jgi:Fe-S oxidoreductase
VFLDEDKVFREELRGLVGCWLHVTRPTFRKSEGWGTLRVFFGCRCASDVAVTGIQKNSASVLIYLGFWELPKLWTAG